MRCEFDVPRFAQIRKQHENHIAEDHFAWFQIPHDFDVPSSQKVENELRFRILCLGNYEVVNGGRTIRVKKT